MFDVVELKIEESQEASIPGNWTQSSFLASFRCSANCFSSSQFT